MAKPANGSTPAFDHVDVRELPDDQLEDIIGGMTGGAIPLPFTK
jgi:hypothetical protein